MSLTTSGVDGLGERGREHLQYGLKNKLFTQEQVDAAQVQYRGNRAKEEFGFIPTSGVDGLGERGREHLQYGLKNKLFTQEQVDAAQKKYEASHPKYHPK